MNKVLAFIAQKLTENGVNYHFQEYKTDNVKYPYSIGTIMPMTPMTEDGKREYTLTVNTFNRGSLLELLAEVEKIETAFDYVEGECAVYADETIVGYAMTSQPVNTGDSELQRVITQIRIKTWKGRN